MTYEDWMDRKLWKKDNCNFALRVCLDRKNLSNNNDNDNNNNNNNNNIF